MNTFSGKDPLLSVLATYEKEVNVGGLPFTTPKLIVDKRQMQKNVDRMNDRLATVMKAPSFRPHLKTVKSAAMAAIMTAGHDRGVCVSTVAEVGYFAKYGYTDIMYSVGFAASKTSEILEILHLHPQCHVQLVLDSIVVVDQIKEQIVLFNQRKQATIDAAIAAGEPLPAGVPPAPMLLTEKSPATNNSPTPKKGTVSEPLPIGHRLQVLIEIDCGHGRGGMPPTSDNLIPVAKAIAHDESSAFFQFGGVVTHGGHGYGAKSDESHAQVTNDELTGISTAVKRLEKEMGLRCPIVSVGSTPTCTRHGSVVASGVTEVRAGVYPMMDLDQYGIGSCDSVDDIALTVLTTVVGHNKTNGRLIIDAGGLAMSKDISASKHAEMQPTGAGWIAGYPELYVSAMSQEHGMVTIKPNLMEDPSEVAGQKVAIANDGGGEAELTQAEAEFSRPLLTSDEEMFAEFPLGTRMRVIPNHACITASGHDHFVVVDPTRTTTTKDSVDIWSRLCGYQNWK